MSWLYSRVLVEAFLAANYSDGGPSVLLSTMPMPQAFLFKDKTKNSWNRFPSGMTCELLTAEVGEELLTWFLAAFPVKTSRLPKDQKHKEYTDQSRDCGKKWFGSLARFDPVTCSWRIPQLSLLGDWELFSETWPRWGIMHDGVCSALLMLEHDTSVKECGSLPIYGTPIKTQRKRSPYFLASNKNLNPYEHCPKGYLPNPQWVEELMGWPIGWTDLKPLVTDKFQQWLHLHGKF